MDLFIHASAFSLGVKRSNIKLPWEVDSKHAVFGKRPRLLQPPVFYPVAPEKDEQVSLPRHESEGRIRWSRRTSVVPWPIAQERSLARALESWRVIVMDNFHGSLVGLQILRTLQGHPESPSIERTLSDALAGKALSTLRARSSSLLAFGRWKKSMDSAATIFPVTEHEAYMYVRELREHNAPKTKPSRFLEALTFSHHMLGAQVDEAMSSPRVKGAAIIPMVLPRKKTPLTFPQVAFLERMAMEEDGPAGIFAGYVCMILHMRLRWSDGQFCQHEPITDLYQGRGFLECQLYHHKNAGRQKQAKRLLPAACVIPGFSGEDWASPWLDKRRTAGLAAGPGVPTMPAPLASGGWALTPLDSTQATSWMRELLRNFLPAPPLAEIATHSLKATILSMMAKAGCDGGLRRLAGYHVDPTSRMALEYSRDAQAPVLHSIEAICLAVQNGLFDPDAPRSRRWPRLGCRTLEQAMSVLSRRSEESSWYEVRNLDHAESPEPSGEGFDEWSAIESKPYSPSEGEPAGDDDGDTLSSLSDPDERPEFCNNDGNTDSEEQEAEVAGPIVGEGLARDLAQHIQDRVYKHRFSGCCHLAKDGLADPSDGEAIVLKCGKLASKNFEEVPLAGNFLPYKCSRCFSSSEH